MTSERMRRNLERLLDEAEAALSASNWTEVAGKARAALVIEPGSTDALGFLRMAEANGAGASALLPGGTHAPESASPSPAARERGPGGEGSAVDSPAPLDAERIAELAAAAEHSGNPLDRLEEGVFVGRARELERLRTALDGAIEGRGALVMLVGEPGIGKTRTTQELAAYARSRDVTVLWGGARESAGAPPYWPWVQAARSYRDQTPEDERRRAWQPYAVELQRIFSGLRELFPNLPPPPEVDTEEGAFRLYDAFSSFLRAVAERTPLLVVLDDLHWADHATLRMLAHLVHELAHARLLVVGTYRDTDLDRRHPLAQTLADLNREDLFTRIPVRGLAEPESTEYIRRTTGLEPAPELAQRIYEETEGNPFFLAEVVNLMAQEGTLSASARDVQIPEGVRQALGRRLDRLSDEANVLLTTLAVAGREFDHALAVRLSGHDDATTLGLLEEALRARVLEEPGPVGRYRFRHALMQETLLGELSAARQVLVHGQVAEAMEALYGLDDGDHLAELAEHYAESAVLNAAHAGKAVRTLRLAADQSMAALGYVDAARQYERCLAIIEQARDPYGEDEAVMWAALAMCHRALGELSSGREALERAVALFAGRGDAHGGASAWAEFMQGFGTAQYRAEQTTLDALIAALGDEDSVDLCRLLAIRGMAELGPEGDAGAARAGAVALRIGLTGATVPYQLTQRAWYRLIGQGAFREAAALMDAMAVVAGSPAAFARSNLHSFSLACAGDVEGWLASRADSVAHARTYRSRFREAQAVGDLAAVAWRRGERAHAEQLVSTVDLNTDAMTLLLPAAIALADGETATALRLAPADDHPAAVAQSRLYAAAFRAQVRFRAGDSEAARTALAGLLTEWDRWAPTEQSGVLGLADVAVAALVKEPEARAFMALLDRIAELRCYPSRNGVLGNPDVLRGALALRFDELDAAEQHFRTGLDWASQPDVRFIVDQGRCLQGLAEVAERRGDLDAARAHLDAAAALFAQHGGARLYLAEVEARRQEWRL